MNEREISKLLDIINVSTGALNKKGIEDARLNVDLIMCHVLNCDRLKLYLDFDKPLTVVEKNRARELLRRRMTFEPLQYILGETGFFNYKFKVNKSVLIPRPETELLVELCLKEIVDSGKNEISILEVGTGSGCISISIAKELEKLSLAYKIVSLDISQEVIDLANKNKKMNDVQDAKLIFLKKDFLGMKTLNAKIDYLISNPPYVNIADYNSLPRDIKDFEPRAALTDDSDGMTFFRKFIELKKNSDHDFKVITEIAYDQYDKLKRLLDECGFRDSRFTKDYGGIYRIAEF